MASRRDEKFDLLLRDLGLDDESLGLSSDTPEIYGRADLRRNRELQSLEEANQEMGLLDRLGTTLSSGYRASSAEPGRMAFELGGADEVRRDQFNFESDDPLLGVKVAFQPALQTARRARETLTESVFGDKSISQAWEDSAALTREELDAARAEKAAAQAELEGVTAGSTALRTVGDLAGSAESYLAIPAAAAGSVAGPGGTVAGAAIGSLPSAEKAFYSTYDETMLALQADIDAGRISREEADSAAIERAVKQTSNEYGTEVALSLLPFAKVLNRVGGSTVGRQVATRVGATIAGEGTSEAVTGAVGNEIDRTTAALDPNAVVRERVGGMVEDVTSEDYLAARGREFLAGALGGAVTSPVVIPTAIKEARDAVQADTEQRILDAKERARRLNTPTANNLANAFERGVREASANSPEQLNLDLPGVDEVAPGVGGAIEAETQQAMESELAARQPEPVTPLNRLSREADQLRGTIETAAENPEALNEVEQANVADNIDRLNEVENRMANIDRAPTQGDLFNVVTDPNVAEIEKERRAIEKQKTKDAAKAEEKAAMESAAKRREFRRSFLEANPNATAEEVLAAEGTWQQVTSTLRPVAPDTAGAAVEARVAEKLSDEQKKAEANAKREQTKRENEYIAAQIKSGNTDVRAIAQGLTTAAKPKTATPAIPTATTVKAEEDSEALSNAVADVLRKRRAGPKAAVDISGIEVDEGTPEFDPTEIEEADVRELAQKNPNLRQHLAGTAVRPVMYHGTRAAEDIQTWRAGPGQLGVHMTANQEVAKQFTENGVNDPNARVLRLAPKITNPVRLQDMSNWDAASVAPQLVAMGKITQEQADAAIAAYAEALGPANEGADAANAVTGQLLKDAGFDGVMYVNRFEIPGMTPGEWRARLRDSGLSMRDISTMSDARFKEVFPEADVSVIAIDSNQVKDVDRNSGEFDTTNPNIKAAATQDVTNYREYRANLADVTEAFPAESAERRLIEAHATATTPAKRIAAAFDFIEETLGDSTNDQFLRTFVLPALRRLAPLIKDVVLFPDRASLQYNGGNARGLFFPDTGKIQIARNGMSGRIMVHEMLHAATWGALRNPKFVAANPDVAAAVAGINKARDLVQAWVDNGGVSRLPEGEAKKWLQSGVGRLIDENNQVDVDELITYIFTEPSVGRALREIKAPGMLRNAWRTVVNAVRQMLSLKPDQTDVVDVVLTEGVELLKALSVSGNAPTSRDTINSIDYRKRGEDTLTMTANVAAKASPAAPATPDIATRLVSERSVAGRGKDKATGKGTVKQRGTVSNVLGKWFRGSRGLAPEAVTEVLVNEEGMTAAGVIELREQYLAMRDLVGQNASKFFSKKGDHWEKFVTMMDNYENATDEAEKAMLGDEIRNAFGERVIEILEDMRTKIDQRSEELIVRLYEDAPRDSDGNPVLSKDLTRQLNAIAANIGKYNHRSYAIFDKKLGEQHKIWLTQTGPGRQVYDAAIKYLVKNDVHIPEDKDLNKMSREALERRAAVWTTATPGLPIDDLRARLREVRDNPQAYNKDAMVENAVRLAEDIIDNNSTPATRYYLSERADQSVLKKREKVPFELRKLMGENADPGFRVLQTVLKQDQLLNKLRAFREIADRFAGIYVFDNLNEAPAGFKQMQGDSLGALAGKWVHPDVAAVLDTQSVTAATIATMFDNPENLAAVAASAASSASRGMKGGLLLFNALGYAYNLAGSFATILANGHVGKLVTNPSIMKEAIQTIIENNRALAGGNFTPRVEEMFRRVINDPAMTGEMQQISFQDAINRVYEREAVDNARTKFEKATDKAGWVWDRMFDLYAAMDLWAKIFNYYAEVAELRGLNDTLPAKDKMDEERLRRTAAERVRQSNLSYERAVPAARAFDRTGVTLFATYTTEVFRSLGAGASLVNSDMQLAKEMEEAGNTEAATYLRKMAAKRSAGIVGVTLAGSITGKAITSTVVAGLQMLGLLAAGDYSDEEEEMIIQAAKDGSPWMADKDIGVAGKDPNTGLPVVIDYGRGNPYDPAANAMRLLAEGKVQEAAITTAGGISPLAAWVANIDGQRTRTPRTVREGGAVAEGVAQLSARGIASRETSLPIINLLEVYAPTQVEAALIGEMTANDTIGYRPVQADPLKLLGRSGIGRDVAAARDEFNKNIADPAVLRSDSAIDAMVAGTAAAELELYRKANNAVRLAKAIGVPRKELEAALEDSSLRKDVAAGLLRENFVPSILSEEVLNRAKETALEAATSSAERSEINARFRYLKRQLSERRRQALLEESN